jgi:hypothetical protein
LSEGATSVFANVSFVGFSAIGLPVALTLMGVAMAIWLPDSQSSRVAWMAAFVLVGAAAVAFAALDRRLSEATASGGTQFPVVSALYGSGMDPKGKFPLVITNPGTQPIYDVTVLVFQAMDFPANGRTLSLGTLYPFPSDFMRRLNLEVPIGSYTIHINTKGTPQGFYERLDLVAQENGEIRQHYYVCKPPIGYVCKKEDRIMDTQ